MLPCPCNASMQPEFVDAVPYARVYAGYLSKYLFIQKPKNCACDDAIRAVERKRLD